MPRSASTNAYTLPFNQFVTGQPILSAQFTGLSPAGNFTDIATVLTATVPISPAAGVALMTGPLPLAAGSAALPSLIMGTDVTTGFYRVAINSWGFSASGSLAVTFNANGTVTFANPLQTLTVSGTATFSNSLTVAATALFSGEIAVGTSSLAKFDCRFTASPPGANVVPTLLPYAGNFLFINGQNYVIPSAGVALTNSGLSASTRYYVYALQTTGVISLEASGTAPVRDTTFGHMRKTGDATRTLVGAVYTDAGTLFNNSDANLTIASFYNRLRVKGWTYFTADRTVSTGGASTWPPTWSEINSEIRSTYLAWSEDQVTIYHKAQITVTTSLTYCYSGIAIDGNIAGLATDAAQRIKPLTGGLATVENINFEYAVNYTGSQSLPSTATKHSVSMMGAATNASTWYSDSGNSPGTQINGACCIGVEVFQ